MTSYLVFLWFVLLIACGAPIEKNTPQTIAIPTIDSTNIPIVLKVPLIKKFNQEKIDSLFELNDTTWVDIENLDSNIVMELRYATTNNFMKTQIYDCPKCYLRLATAKALLKVQDSLLQQGLSLKMFDCYRPQQAQYKLWQVKPDPRFVSPPSRGSMHSRGGAVDLTIINTETGEELDMGTEYDYFGVEGYWSYTKHPKLVSDNRQLLLKIMNEFGFKTVTTEWWHFSYRRAWYNLSSMEWDCPDSDD